LSVALQLYPDALDASGGDFESDHPTSGSIRRREQQQRTSSSGDGIGQLFAVCQRQPDGGMRQIERDAGESSTSSKLHRRPHQFSGSFGAGNKQAGQLDAQGGGSQWIELTRSVHVRCQPILPSGAGERTKGQRRSTGRSFTR
jgi:hypothetical protein